MESPEGSNKKQRSRLAISLQQQQQGLQYNVSIFWMIVVIALTVVVMSTCSVLASMHMAKTTARFDESLSSLLSLSASSTSSSSSSSSFELARQQSFGFFTNIADTDWRRLQESARREELFFYPHKPNKTTAPPNGKGWEKAVWMLENIDPIFTGCLHMKRVGGRGDGPKWTCDPHRLVAQQQQNQKAQPSDCLIYSIGSRGHYQFEDGLVELLQREQQKLLNASTSVPNNNPCEIHVFDPNPKYNRLKVHNSVNNIHYHAWGLKSSYRTSPVFGPPEFIFKSFPEMVQELGHTNRRIDILKIDCEGCEWTTYKDWAIIPGEDTENNNKVTVDIRQILLETHLGMEQPADVSEVDFFRHFVQKGFLPYSKEANSHPAAMPRGCLFEFSFLRLDQQFLSSLK